MGDGEEVLQRKLETTPTWVIAIVCFVMLAISILIEHSIEELGKVYSFTKTTFCILYILLSLISCGFVIATVVEKETQKASS